VVDKPQWRELFSEVVTSGLCTGCAACVVACPYDVLKYETEEGAYRPWHVDEDGGREDCTHGQKGCTICTRACPRFRNWEGEVDTHLFARERTADEVYGVGDVVLARASDPEFIENGQDGGFVTALLAYALENNVVDAALVSGLEGDGSNPSRPQRSTDAPGRAAAAQVMHTATGSVPCSYRLPLQETQPC